MSNGLSPKLPLTKDPKDGYALNKTYTKMVQQNLKMLILTAPGERMMDPFFGVGLRNYLFSNKVQSTNHQIEAKIREQIAAYMPFVEIVEIKFSQNENDSLSNTGNNLYVYLSFNIVPLDVSTSLEINTESN